MCEGGLMIPTGWSSRRGSHYSSLCASRDYGASMDGHGVAGCF